MHRFALVLATGSLMASPWAAAHDEDDGNIDLSFRYRYETVDDDAFAEKAKASTIRSRLTIKSGRIAGLELLAEVDNVHEISGDDYDDGTGTDPARTRFPVVADPEGTELNQVYLDYDGFDPASFRVGRQRINRNNQRFVGGVGWRQNEQTFDAAAVEFDWWDSDVSVAYLKKAHRILGDDVPGGNHDLEGSWLFDANTKLGGWGKATGYHYRIDNSDVAAFSTRTTGVRVSGTQNLDGIAATLGFGAEYAEQRDATNNPISFNADYYRLDLSFAAKDREIAIGRESLSGDAVNAGRAFRTPLATLHAFNGWADKFLTTPDAGLVDDFVRFKMAPGDWVFEARYHEFSAEDGSGDFGEEWDFRLGESDDDGFRWDLFYARFKGDGGLSDTSKFWVMLTFGI